MDLDSADAESNMNKGKYYQDKRDIHPGMDDDNSSQDLNQHFADFIIEPEVIIKEFSIENLQQLKKIRFMKDALVNCPVCDKNFRRNSHLKRHLLIHTQEKPFICDVCNRSFNQSSTMKSHKQSLHSTDKPFVCTEPNCTKSFSFAGALKMHLKSHLLIKEFKCEYCGKYFKYRNSMKKHVKKHIALLNGTRR